MRAAIDAVCGSRPGKALKRGREYFKRNGGRGRMDYARIAALKLPIGSGAIESAIRRVVNLRLKGPSISWHKTSAEAVLLLRSYYKAGHAGIILRGRHLRLQQGSPREPKEMDRSHELVDFYHAVEHLGKIAALQRRWTAAERQAWIGRQRRRLLKGGAEEVRAAIDAVCGSRPGKALKREREYFKRNGGRGRMDYARIAALKLPIGSGAIESAIRRVVNLRLKGPSISWHKTSAEAVLLLRSYYKAGRWNHLERRHLRLQQGSPREPKEMDRSRFHCSRLLVTSATRFLSRLIEAWSSWYLLFQRSRLFRKNQIRACGGLLYSLVVCFGA